MTLPFCAVMFALLRLISSCTTFPLGSVKDMAKLLIVYVPLRFGLLSVAEKLMEKLPSETDALPRVIEPAPPWLGKLATT
jgi:hypothetical protein